MMLISIINHYAHNSFVTSVQYIICNKYLVASIYIFDTLITDNEISKSNP